MGKTVTKEAAARGQRIAHVRSLLGLGQERFASLLDVSRGAVGNWELGQPIALSSMTILCERTGADLDWLANGRGARPEAKSDLGRAVAPTGFEFADDVEPTPKMVSANHAYRGDLSNAIPDVDTSAGAGAGGYGLTLDSTGSTMVHGDAVRGEIVLPPYLLSEFTRSDASNVHAIMVRGDSMETTLRSGDRVFVDTMDHNIGQGGIFVLVDRRTNEVLVKRLRRARGGKEVLVISDNPKQGEPEMVAAHEIYVVGRAVGRLTRL